MPAGPSEVLVIADQSADADFIAADLLSQAEHGTDSQVVLVTTSPSLPAAVQSSIENNWINWRERPLRPKRCKTVCL